MNDARRAQFLDQLWRCQKDAGLSVDALARAIRVDPSYVRLLRAGKRTRPSLEVMHRAASVFPSLAGFLLPAELLAGHTDVPIINDEGAR